MEILSIGNSFSQDATRYLHAIADSDGTVINTTNLFIGGCTLATHHANMLSGDALYLLEYNGKSSGKYISLTDALEMRAWDVVTLQQASPKSFDTRSYFPYITELCNTVRKKCPNAKIYIHETWAYEDGCNRLHNIAGFDTSKEMLDKVVAAYEFISKEINADKMIRSGELFGKLIEQGTDAKIHRDTYHASLGLGRYALGLIWYKTLCGAKVSENKFCDFDESISENDIDLVKRTVDSM